MKNVHNGALRILVAVGLSLLVSCSSGATTENEVLITILKVVDGDTVDIDIKGNTERVRLIFVISEDSIVGKYLF